MQEKEGGDGVKQILVILGGGRRNGNTKQLADSFVSGLRRQDIRWKLLLSQK